MKHDDYKYKNYYECPDCEHTWQSEWDSKCDDECPACGTMDIAPFRSEELVAVKVHISPGNMKIGKIPNISLLPGGCCADDAPCRNECYAMKAYKLYPGTRAAWGENTALADCDPCEYFGQIKQFLFKKKPEFFRWHVAGDILNGKYLQDMIDIANLFRETKFLAFTKRLDLLWQGTEAIKQLPANLTLIQSMWPGWGTPIDGYPVAWMQDGRETRIPSTAFVCPGNCTACGQMCWSMVDGTHVVFHKH